MQRMSNDRTQTDWLDVITAIYLEVYGTDLDWELEIEDFIEENVDLKAIIKNAKEKIN